MTRTVAGAIRERETAALAAIPAELAALPRDIIELKADNMVGIAALDTLFTARMPAPPGRGWRRPASRLAGWAPWRT